MLKYYKPNQGGWYTVIQRHQTHNSWITMPPVLLEPFMAVVVVTLCRSHWTRYQNLFRWLYQFNKETDLIARHRVKFSFWIIAFDLVQRKTFLLRVVYSQLFILHQKVLKICYISTDCHENHYCAGCVTWNSKPNIW